MNETAYTPGATVWLTGLPSAGKSTIANEMAQTLRAAGRRVEILDGDEIRANLCPDLGFSRPEREENVRRIGWLARRLAHHGVIVLVPVIAPYASSRTAVRESHRELGVPYIEVHVTTPIDVCVNRDVKGLYGRQARGELTGLTGIDDPYEVPEDPDLRVDTKGLSPAESADLVIAVLPEPLRPQYATVDARD